MLVRQEVLRALPIQDGDVWPPQLFGGSRLEIVDAWGMLRGRDEAPMAPLQIGGAALLYRPLGKIRCGK